MDNRLSTIHELHTAINREFEKAGIEIAFPQRDLHIRSIETPVRIFEQNGTPAADAVNGNDDDSESSESRPAAEPQQRTTKP